MKLSVIDLKRVVNLAKTIKPAYVRFISRKKKLYAFFAQDTCILAYEFNSTDPSPDVDITVSAVPVLQALSTLPAAVSLINFEFTSQLVTMKYTKSTVSFKSLGHDTEEFISGIDSIFENKGTPHDIMEDIARSWPTFGTLADSVFGWQLAADDQGYKISSMTDRTIACVFFDDGEPLKQRNKIIATVPEQAANLIVQFYKAYKANNKLEKNREYQKDYAKGERGSKNVPLDLPQIYIDDSSVGYPFCDQIAFRVAVNNAHVDIDTFRILDLADSAKPAYVLDHTTLVNIFNSTDGFDGTFVEIHTEDSMRMVFNSNSVTHEKLIGEAAKGVKPIKFTVPYKEMRSIVNSIPKEKTVDVSLTTDDTGRAKALVLNCGNTVSIVQCGK